MSTTVKNASVSADVFVTAVVEGRKAKKSNKEIAASINMKPATFSVRLSQMKKKILAAEGGADLFKAIGSATRTAKVDLVAMLKSKVDALDAPVAPEGETAPEAPVASATNK